MQTKDIIKQRVCVIAGFLILSCWISSVFAQQIPHFIKYQVDGEKILEEIGKGKKEKDKGKEKDLYTLTFRIYNIKTGGVVIWKETHLNVSIKKKEEFEVLLGTFTPLDLRFDEDYWLSVEIENKGEIEPRERMTSFGYAYMAEDSYKLGGWYADDFALFGHSHIGEDVVSPVAEAINADTVDGLHAYQIGGVKDHGELLGLADDDHLQYLNTVRGDERYAGLSWDGVTKLETAQFHIADKNNPHLVTLGQLGHLDNNPEEEAPTLTERGEPTGTEIQGWADDITSWGHSNLVANLNADMVDGFHATSGINPLPNTLLALGADGKFPLSVIPPITTTGLWTDAGSYIYPNNTGNSFQITDTGNLLVPGSAGIGTQSALAKLDVRVGSTSNNGILISEDPTGGFLIEGDYTQFTPNNKLHITGTGFAGANGRYLTIVEGGRIGIGTANPQFGLDINAVSPDVTGSHRVRIYNDTPARQTGYMCGLSDWSHSGDFSYYGPGYAGGQGSELLTGDSVILSSASGVTNGIRIIAANNGAHSAPIIFATGLWYAAAAERMRITSSGNVGIGTISPSEKLDVGGTAKLTGFKMPTGAVNGYVMTSDVNGTGSWQPAASGGIPDNTISQAKLKTAVGEVAVSDGPVTLPGGEYGFYPQVKGTWFADSYGRGISIVGKSGSAINIPSYTTVISQSGAFGTNYVKQRYVTSSGEDYWIFLLLDNSTKNVIASYAAPDHPAYGNGGDFVKLPHPFDSYDKIKHEIIIVDKRTVDQLKQESKLTGKSIITLVSEEYKPDMDSEESYQPLHSGKYLTTDGKQVKELVTALPDYIKVRKLIKLTEYGTQQRKIVSQEKLKGIEQLRQKREQDKLSAINKLQGLGLSQDEIKALVGEG